MNVFIVYQGDYDDRRVVGVFTSPAPAIALGREKNDADPVTRGDSVQVEEWELDGGFVGRIE